MRSRYYDPPDPNQTFGKIPPTLPKTGCSGGTPCGVLAFPTQTTAQYDSWLQNTFDNSPFFVENGTLIDKPARLNSCYDSEGPELNGYMRYTLQTGSEISRIGNIPFIFMPQAHQWFYPWEIDREPTNEELDVMANLAVSYGARGLMWWAFPGWDDYSVSGCPRHMYGMMNPDGSIRSTNVYEQSKPKWEVFHDIGTRMKVWEPYIMSFDNTNRHSYIYRNEDERTSLINNSYFADVVSYLRGTGVPACTNDIPENNYTGPTDPALRYECKDDRYLQVATFQKSADDGNKYFMVVNRRCSPLQSNHDDGQRYLRIRFNNSLPGPGSWKIIDLETGLTVNTFSKSANMLVDFGWLAPGQGKLYKLTPVLKSGGVLVSDEVITDENFICEDTVWNNGYNITFKGNGNTISFTDSATIVMNGGTFQTDSASDGPRTSKNTFQAAVSGHKWSGLHFNGTNVKIYNSKFQDISSPVGGSYAVNCIDCPLNDIRYNTFISSTDTAGGVYAAFASPDLTIPAYNTYIMNNTFTMNNSYSRAVQLQGYAGLTVGAFIENNTMTSSGYATGIFVSTGTGGVIKNNIISGFATGINTLLTSCDLYGNTITNTGMPGDGIVASDLSYINLAPTSSGEWTGGMNSLTNTGNSAANLSIDNSAFYISGGYNTFDIDSTKDFVPYHLVGSFWESDFAPCTRIEGNCFKFNESSISEPTWPHASLTTFSNSPVDLNIFPYTCDGNTPTNYDITDIGNGINDTIPNMNGMGGGESSVASPKITYDSICVQMRHRNYGVVKNLCYELINTYPDSAQSITSLQTLFMASIASDTTQTSYGNLKTYYENLILNHGSNGALVKISNYMVQKCKVLLRQYSSALAGFQQIINNNQYNYEGLLARWDYMATSLLMNGQGGGEGISDFGLSIADLKNQDESEEIDPASGISIRPLPNLNEYDELGDDKTPFTKDQKISIRKSINRTLEGSKKTDEQKIDVLKQKTKDGDKTAEHELLQRNALKNINRTEHPKNIFEHLKIVNGDIQKIFGNHEPLRKDPKSQVPMVYNLYQNFPNPFNPSTKINFDLPKDSKVTLVIYDILGRVVKRLLNSEFRQAGRYSIDFNASNYASGVYFYRIESGDYVMSKKMVLVK